MTSVVSNIHLHLPTLPLELWIVIIGYLCQFTKRHDLAYLWTECRNISTLFRQEIERLFIAKYLSKTRVEFNLLGMIHVLRFARVTLMAN